MNTHPFAALDDQADVNCYKRDDPIGTTGMARGDWYRVMSGLVRRCAFFPDGRRQSLAFLFPGDVLGFGQPGEGGAFAAEAVVRGTLVARYPRRAVERLIESDSAASALIRSLACHSLHQTEARLLNLGRMTASERVGSFLLELAQRSGSASPTEFSVPMSRYDIADYLALSVETVSRTLTQLQHNGAITLRNVHHVRIANREALSAQL